MKQFQAARHVVLKVPSIFRIKIEENMPPTSWRRDKFINNLLCNLVAFSVASQSEMGYVEGVRTLAPQGAGQ
jgi:hypothetical protein